MEEADIILNFLKKGERKGLEMLFQKFYKPLVLYAFKFLRDLPEAEDVVQEVFINFWKRDKFVDIEFYLRSYLYQSVRNTCLNCLQVKKNISPDQLDSVKSLYNEEFPDEEQFIEQLEIIYKEIEKLPYKTRMIFRSIVLENKKYKEVAEEQQISVNTVKTLLVRALSTLRNRLNSFDFILLQLLF